MAKPFSVETEEQRFRLPTRTREQIKALTVARASSARQLIIDLVAAEYRSEFPKSDKPIII